MRKYRLDDDTKNRSGKNRRRTYILVVLSAIIIAVGVSLYLHNASHSNTHTGNSTVRPVNSVDYSGSSKALHNINDPRKGPSQSSNGPIESNSQNNSSISVVVTRAQSDGTNLQVGTLIGGVTSGECTLTVSQVDQAPIIKTEPVIQNSNTYACPVFSIPLTEFSNRNNWNVSVKLTSQNESVTAEYHNNPINLGG